MANASVQVAVDARLRGRVMGLYMLAFIGGTPIGSPLVGALVVECRLADALVPDCLCEPGSGDDGRDRGVDQAPVDLRAEARANGRMHVSLVVNG